MDFYNAELVSTAMQEKHISRIQLTHRKTLSEKKKQRQRRQGSTLKGCFVCPMCIRLCKGQFANVTP